MAGQGILTVFLFVSLSLPGLKSEICSVDEAEQSQVTYLLERMLNSFDPMATPNPSILLALRLDKNHNLEIEHCMAQRLKEEAVQRVKNNQNFSSGEVALYVLALQASCEDPQEVSALNSTIDLVQMLEEKYQEELQSIEEKQTPLSNYYQLGLDILALCLQDIPVDVSAVLDPSCDSGKFTYGSVFSVDTGAVIVLSLTCVNTRGSLTPKEKGEVEDTLRCLVEKILNEKQNNGVIGNIYSTGLAMQALFVSQDYYSPSEWNCTQTLAAAVGAISQAKFDNPMAASQITPSLGGRTYLDARGLNCSADEDTLPIISTPTPPPAFNLSEITVSYTVIDDVTHTFSNSITVSVLEGATFLVVMEKAQELDPEKFSFEVQQSSWGPYLVSVNNLTASTNDKTYWQLLNGTTPLEQGVGDYKPYNGEHLVAKFTTY